MQLELPPFSAFVPPLLLMMVLGGTAAWGWSLGLLAMEPDGTRLLPAWLWTVLLVIAPIATVPVFLVIGAPPISSRVWRAVAAAATVAVIVTGLVVATQQIGILDCRTVARDPMTEVCEREPRSEVLPVGLGVVAAFVVGTLVGRRRGPGRAAQPSAT